MRHGESLGNVDAATYVHVADARIPLSEKGHMDATKTGRAIQRIAGDGPYYFYTSPYLRTKQTLAGIIGELGESEVRRHAATATATATAGITLLLLLCRLSYCYCYCYCYYYATTTTMPPLLLLLLLLLLLSRTHARPRLSQVLAVKEEPRVTEQQFGNFQNLLGVKQAKEERARFGRFYYRFTNGESGLDVCVRCARPAAALPEPPARPPPARAPVDSHTLLLPRYNRATAFISTLWRDMQKIPSDDVTVVVVTHGLTMRLILMRWFGYVDCATAAPTAATPACCTPTPTPPPPTPSLTSPLSLSGTLSASSRPPPTPRTGRSW